MVEEIRNKRGLAYSVASFFDPGKSPRSFQIVLQTENASARKAIAICLKKMKQIQEVLVSERELEGAEKYLDPKKYILIVVANLKEAGMK